MGRSLYSFPQSYANSAITSKTAINPETGKSFPRMTSPGFNCSEKTKKKFCCKSKAVKFAAVISVKKLTIMNKADLIDVIAEEAGITKTQANAALDSFTNAVTKTLKGGGKVTLVGFGTFLLSYREGRKGHNPQTKAQINIKEKVVARFKGGKELLATLKSSMKDLKPLLQKKKKK
jgi:DNA-binding protein HU-beta